MDEQTIKALEKLKFYKPYLTGPQYRELQEKVLNGELVLEAKGGQQLEG